MCEERRRAIIELLEAERRVRVEELSRRFGVSEVTIRKDLAELEARGLLQRVYGRRGASPQKSLLPLVFWRSSLSTLPRNGRSLRQRSNTSAKAMP